MRIQTPENAIKSLPREILDVLGAPPLLSTEDAKIYYTVFAYFVNYINPNDILVWMWIKDLADYRWEILRLRRNKVDIMQRAQDKFLAQAELNATNSDGTCRASLNASYCQRIKELEKKFADNPEELKTGKVKCTEHHRAKLKDADKTHQKNLSGLKALKESSRAVAYSLPSWIAEVQMADRLLEVAEKRFYNTLRTIECHLGGFGETIRQRGEKILDGEVVTASTAAPGNGNGKQATS
jgi:hypothetical protein